jgi:hypothetical protein
MCVSKKKKKKNDFPFPLTTGTKIPDTGVTCNNAPPELTPLHIVPGGVTGVEATYYRVSEFLVRDMQGLSVQQCSDFVWCCVRL